MRLFLIVAAADNDVIGRDGDLPWHLPADLRRFKQLTSGHPIVMGRLTYESIGRPLPGRRNVVLSRDPGYAPAGVEVYDSLGTALRALAEVEIVWVIGGAGVFSEALADAERIYLTRVHAMIAGDVHFPRLDPLLWERTAVESHAAEPPSNLPYSFEIWERRARG